MIPYDSVKALTTRDVKSSGIRLRVTDVGEGPVLVLLHSALLNRKSWEPIQEALSQEFRLIIPDLPGFGESEKPAASRFAYTFDAFRGVVTDLFAGLQLGQAHLVGHGLGASIALGIAAHHAELVDRLVLLDAHCYRTGQDIARRLAGMPLAGGLLFKQLLGKAAFRRYFRDVLCADPSRIPGARADAFFETLAPPEGRGSALLTLRNTNDSRSVVAQLSRIVTPTLVLWGRHDRVCSASLGRRMAREIRGAGFELLDAGHLPHEEAPDAVAQRLTDFCHQRRAG